MLLRLLVISFFLALLTACGGGSGGSSSDQPPVEPKPPVTENPDRDGDDGTGEDADPPEDDSETPPPGEDTDPESPPDTESDGQMPQANILFPWEQSAAKAGKITVRGTATDSSGIESVWVNGKQATVSAPATVAAAVNNDLPSSGTRKHREHQISVENDGETNTSVDWEVEIDLPGGQSEITLEVTDGSGETDTEADTASVSFTQVPTRFFLNDSTQTIVGLADSGIVDYDFVNQKQNVLEELDSLPLSYCYDSTAHEIYYINSNTVDSYTFLKKPLSSDQSAEVIHQESKNTEHPSFTEEIFCDSANNNLYLLVHHDIAGEGIDTSIIYRLDLSETPAWSVVYETGIHGDKVVDDIEISEGGLLAQLTHSGDLVQLSVADGSMRTLYKDYAKFTLDIVSGSTLENIYLVNFDGVDMINVSEGTITEIGYHETGHSLEFAQPRSSVLDQANSRVLIGDSALDSIIGIDLNTGERSLALTSGIGDGPKLIAPRGVALNSAVTHAYLVDDGGNAAAKVVQVDLATGDREVIGNIHDGSSLFVTGIVYDENAGQLYVSNQSTVFKINIESNDTTVIASNTVGLGTVYEGISAIALDSQNGTLYFADDQSEKIVALNLENNQRSLVSGSSRGTGEVFGNINGMVFNSENNTLYVTNQLYGTVQTVDPATGNRMPIALGCSEQGFGADESLTSISYNSSNKELLILGDGVSALNLETGVCEMVSFLHALGINAISDERLFIVNFGELALFDRLTGESVVVSK